MENEKIDFTKIGCRTFDINELVNELRQTMTIWSWGAHAWTKYKDLAVRFKVNGHHHKGHVYIALAFDDTFDVYITSLQGTIKKKFTGIYIDQLIEVIDKEIEYIPQYTK